jgi:pyochelin biosynthetic protein PchC
VSVVSALPAGASSVWLRRFGSPVHPWIRLVCLPHAGGSAAFFRPWRGYLPPDIELYAVQYPGRMDRFSEPCTDDMEQRAEAVCTAVAPLMDAPVALFGHSLGAVLAYEVARRLPARARRAPILLIVSGRAAPHRQRPTSKHLASDAELWAEIGTLGGTSAELLDDADVRRTFLPALRADYRLAELYRPAPSPRLSCPVTALIGETDTEVDAEEAGCWADVTDAGFSMRTFPGGHFYLSDCPVDVLDEIQRRLLVAGPPRAHGWAGP